MSKVFCVVSENENIGKSYLTLSIANQCVTSEDSRLLVIELAAGDKDIASYFEVDDEIIYDVCDVVGQICDFDQSVIELDDNIDYLPAPRVNSKLLDISRHRFSSFISKMKKTYDLIIIEASKLSSNFYLDFKSYDSIFYLSDCNFSSLKYLLYAKAILIGEKSGKKENISFVFNKCDIRADKYERLSEDDIRSVLQGCDIIFIMNDNKIDRFDLSNFEKVNTFEEVTKKIKI